MDQFSQDFRNDLTELMRWRRDVRHFKPDPVDPDVLSTCLGAFSLAPSVGLSEPWRLVQVQSAERRQNILDNFKTANAEALAGYSGERAALYAGLKLQGIKDAPIQLAVFCDEQTTKGAGLGAQTMPEMRRYSVVAGIMNFWLLTRAHGLGVGWVSILDAARATRELEVPEGWRLVAWLCVGWPKDAKDVPELETRGWERRSATPPTLYQR